MQLNFVDILNSAQTSSIHLKKGDVIYTGNEEVRGVYFLVSGKIKIESAAKKSSKHMLLWLLLADSFFGITSYFKKSNDYSYRATVVSNSAEIRILSKEFFSSLIIENLAFRDYIFRLLYNRLDYINTKKNYNNKVQLRRKVANDLIFFTRTSNLHHQSLPDAVISVNDLAEMNGTTKKQIVFVLNELSTKKIIDSDGDKIVVKNHEKLLRLTQ